MKKLKAFLWSNKITKYPYRFLWYWRNESLNAAIIKFKNKLRLMNIDKKLEKELQVQRSEQRTLKDDYEFIHGIWNNQGATKELIEHLTLLEQSSYSWKKQNHQIWLIFISCLYEKKQIAFAKELLEKYKKYYSYKDIFKYLPVAFLACEMGYDSEKIQKAAYIFKKLEENREKDLFKKLIMGKRIAVVGNSGCELGKGKGVEIDSHDIVIRFNNYPLKNYDKDYGKKTDIWVRGGNIFVEDRTQKGNFKLVLWEPDYWHMQVQHNHLDILYRDINRDSNTVMYLDYGTRISLRDTSKIINPTSGCYVLWYIYRIMGSLDSVNVYGFSFLNGDYSDTGHYYDNLSRINKDHNIRIEIDFLKGLFNKNKQITTRLLRKEIGFPDKKHIYNQYVVPPILNRINFINRKCIKIYACAYRVYDVKKGKTGGPGGVLAMQKEVFGNKYRGLNIEYIFEDKSLVIPENLSSKVEKLTIKAKCNFVASYCIQTNSGIQRDIESGIEPLFICHDIGSAYGAYLCGYQYILIFHQQGGLLNEIKAIHESPSTKDIQVINELEKKVFENAEKVFFPSMGAMKMFCETSETGKYSKNINYSDYPLYNTIPDVTYDFNANKLLGKLKLPIKRADTEIFLSVGDFNEDKGMDQVPEFLNEYIKISKRKILWIGIGNKADGAIFKQLVSEKNNWLFESVLIGERIDHDTLLALIDNSDYYIMLHRRSIFDLAILEAMRAGKPIILTEVGGNVELNKENNIVFADYRNFPIAAIEVEKRNKNKWSELNKKVFEKYFSQEQFFKNYSNMIDSQLEKMGYIFRHQSEINKNTFGKWKNYYKGNTAVICGSGSSLNSYLPIENAIHIALNRALFFEKIGFDILFMQDEPANQNYKLEDYNSYPCIKFYGIITNSEMKLMGMGPLERKFQNVSGNIERYELSPNIYDHRVDSFEEQIDEFCISDGQSVLFSAIQFAVFAGFSKILLCGVDFSKKNYDEKENSSKYARSVINNLLSFKRTIIERHPNIKFEFYKTNNKELLDAFDDLDESSAEDIVVTGIFTENYRNVVELQIKSCKDDYKFDYRFITDNEWDQAKTSSEFAFYGGNTIKTQLVIDKIKQYWGELILVTDADLVFLKKTRKQIIKELGSNDMAFLMERADSIKNPFEKTPANVNIGFVLIRCNERSLNFWEKVQKCVQETSGWDQEVANYILFKKSVELKYVLFSHQFLNGGDVNKKNIKKQRICTACGTVAKRNKLGKVEYLQKILDIANGNEKKWFDGSAIE